MKNKKQALDFYHQLLQPHFHLLFPKQSTEITKSTFLLLCDRSLRFGDYSVYLKACNFSEFRFDPLSLPVPGCERTVQRAIEQLVDWFGLVLTPGGRGPGHRTAVEYVINAPGICKALTRLYLPAAHIIPAWSKFETTCKQSLAHFEDKGWPTDVEVQMSEERFKKMEDAVQAALTQSAAVGERKKAKRKVAPLTLRSIPIYMADTCEELGVNYYEPEWTGRDYRSAKTWLGYCEKTNRDAKVILRQVCDKWHLFRSGQLVNTQGKQIILPPSVSFHTFFLHRREIGEWLASNMDVPGDGGGWINKDTVLDLTDTKDEDVDNKIKEWEKKVISLAARR